MSEVIIDNKAGRKTRTLAEEIAAQREKLKRLEERQKEMQRRERERNQKAIFDLIRAEHLETVPAEKWKQVIPRLKTLLGVGAEQHGSPHSSTTAEMATET